MDITFIKGCRIKNRRYVSEKQNIGNCWPIIDIGTAACYNIYPLVALFKCNLSGHVPDQMVWERGPLHNVIIDVVLPVTARNHTTSTEI